MRKLVIILFFLSISAGILNAKTHQMDINLIDEYQNAFSADAREYFLNSRYWEYGISDDGLPAYKYELSIDEDQAPSIIGIMPIPDSGIFEIEYNDIVYFDRSTAAEEHDLNYPSAHPQMLSFGGIRSCMEYRFSLDGQAHYNIFVVPFIEDSLHAWNFCAALKIEISTSEDHTVRTAMPDPDNVMHSLLNDIIYGNDSGTKYHQHIGAACGFSDSSDFIVITNAELAPSFAPFLLWKRSLGYNARTELIEDIEVEYSGGDLAEKVREYLKAAYQNGLAWLLIGGDETVVPVRKLYSANTNEDVPDEYLHPSDLYYGDLTGEWDVDCDGIWGEPYQDNPDLQPEIFVGRVSACTPQEVSNWVSKTIAYEKGNLPDVENFAKKALITSADQMRDWNAGQGQDSLVAKNFPDYITPDLTSMAEYPSGNDPNPSQPPAMSFIQKYSEGWNLAVILAHGVRQGFVSMSASYNEWPKTYVWVGEGGRSDMGYLDELQNCGAPGIIYSVACSQGAFDAPNDEERCFAEYMLDLENRGAAAFVGYTRYGWVASSYKLAEDFVHVLYSTDNRIGPANAISKLLNSSYRDLNYGLNIFGDPSLRVWTDTPSEILVEHPQVIALGENNFSIRATSDDIGLENALVTVISQGQNLFMGLTGPEGILDLNFNTGIDSGVVLTVSANGHIPYQANLSTSIILDADDDNGDEILPDEFALYQNYPNPANPSTTIGFDLAASGDVSLELYNLLGQKVEFIEQENLPSGYNEVELDLSDFPSGVYFYRLTSAKSSATKKLMLLK